MEVEVLRFLIHARTHLREAAMPQDAGRPDPRQHEHADLQSVERELPDCDWFEREEMRDATVERARRSGGVALQF